MGKLFKAKKTFGGIILSISLFLIGCGSSGSDSYRSYNSNSSNSTVLESPIEKEILRWSVEETIDEMTDTKNVLKTLRSENEEKFSFPYEGGSTLMIEVRYKKETGSEVYLTISKGQLLTSDFNRPHNVVAVRFDEDAPQKFQTSIPSDHSSDCLVINEPQKFINRAKTAKSIKIQVPVYQEGTPLFRFKVDEPLTWEY